MNLKKKYPSKGSQVPKDYILNNSISRIMPNKSIKAESKAVDVDPGPQDPVLRRQYANTHGLQKSCGGKGMAWPLSN